MEIASRNKQTNKQTNYVPHPGFDKRQSFVFDRTVIPFAIIRQIL
jgi:hypothetical protein